MLYMTIGEAVNNGISRGLQIIGIFETEAEAQKSIKDFHSSPILHLTNTRIVKLEEIEKEEKGS